MWWIGGLLILLTIGVVLPVALLQKRNSARIEASHNIRQLHLALFNFDTDYGRFPDATTIADVQSKTHTTLALGTIYSNDYFRQLIATGAAKNETIFWAKTPATPRKPNNILGADALEKGECSFAYVAGFSSSSDASIPIIMTPMIPGTTQFDPDVFNKALILRIDGSAKAEMIRNDNNEVAMPGNQTLFAPSQPYWRGKKPDLKWPE